MIHANSNDTEADDNDITTTIQRMQTAGTCCSPVHYHAFRGSSGWSFRRGSVVCAACHEPIVWSVLQPTAVQCLACSVVAHRACAARKSVWNETNKCQAYQQQHAPAATESTATEREGEEEDNSVNESIVGETKDEGSPSGDDAYGDAEKRVLQESSTAALSSSSDDEPAPVSPPATAPVSPPVTAPPPKSTRRVSSYPGLRKQRESNTVGADPSSSSSNRHQPHPSELDPIDSSWEVTVAAIAGGMAGLMIAGPVGAAGGAIAAAAARQQQSQKRSLLLHNGVSVSVRPQIPTDPVWYNYVAQAVRTAPRRPKQPPMHADITAVAESEMDTHDKILLLVHRTVNDTTSRSGHMYRYLMAIYQDRIVQQQQQPSTTTTASRRRRDDVHAIVRHVTASLVEERPELGAAWTEVTAATVESLVFGQLYASVMEEIVEETCERDVDLWRKITAVKTSLVLEEAVVVSPKAIAALGMLPQSHAATEKLHFLVVFLDHVSQHIMDTEGEDCSADSLLKVVCQHVVYLENNICSYAEIAFLEEFSRDEALLRGREGYALVTMQACLEFFQVTENLKNDVLGIEEEDAL